jgi:hypothetical protein
MEPLAIRHYVNERLALYLSNLPRWYGHADDSRHHAAQRQYQTRRAADNKEYAAEKVRRYESGYRARRAGMAGMQPVKKTLNRETLNETVETESEKQELVAA